MHRGNIIHWRRHYSPVNSVRGENIHVSHFDTVITKHSTQHITDMPPKCYRMYECSVRGSIYQLCIIADIVEEEQWNLQITSTQYLLVSDLFILGTLCMSLSRVCWGLLFMIVILLCFE